MIVAKLARDIRDDLQARGYPVAVAFGRRRFELEGPHRLITIERDREVPDTLGPGPGGRNNPRRQMVRGVAAKALIHARSPQPGATEAEHLFELDRLVDAFLTSLREWGVAARVGALTLTEAKLLDPDERGGATHAIGEAYRVRFVLPRSVDRTDYDGDARPTADLGGVATGVRVSIDGEDFEAVD